MIRRQGERVAHTLEWGYSSGTGGWGVDGERVRKGLGKSHTS